MTLEISKKILAAVFYGTVSSGMAFLNKALLSSYEFKYPFVLLAIQMLVGLIAVEILRSVQIVNLTGFTLSKGIRFWLPSVCCAMHSVLSLLALDGMNIPMYAAIKRCTPFINLILMVVILKKPMPTCSIIFSIILITIGCLIAGIGDIYFDSAAYVFGILSVMIQGTYQTLVQKAAESDYSSLEIFYLNCYNCLLIFVLGSVSSFEISSVYSYPHLTSLKFLACFFLVTTLGAVLNYSLFLCTCLNSALTTSLVGVLKSIIQTVLGFFTFGGVAYHPLIIFGLILNTTGGILYTFRKFKDKKISKPGLENFNQKCNQSV